MAKYSQLARQTQSLTRNRQANNNRLRQANSSPAQMPVKVSVNQGPGLDLFKCTSCNILYTTSPCPLCAEVKRSEQLRQALTNATSRLELLEEENRGLEASVSLKNAMRDAMDLLDADDRLFLKQVLYQWRHDRSVSLKVARTPPGTAPHTLLADYRHTDAEGREFTSIGGRALVGFYYEAQREHGAVAAMKLLLGAGQHLLPGGLDG